MIRIKFIIILFMAFLSISFNQYYNNARMLSMNSAYTTIGRGYSSVGTNPAQLGYSKGFSMNLFTFNFGFHNNLLSLKNYNNINGADLDNPYSDKYFKKDNVLGLLNGNPLTIGFDTRIPLPGLNFSWGQFAVSSNFRLFYEVGLPNALLDLFLFGNEIGKTYVVDDMFLDVIAVNEFGVSYGKKMDQFSIGATVKYLYGMLYWGFGASDTSYFTTDFVAFSGEGLYRAEQGIGGSGIGLDIGFLTDRLSNDWRFGLSIINMIGLIRFTPDNLLWQQIDTYGKPTIESAGYLEYYSRPNEYYIYKFTVDSLNAVNLQSMDLEDLFFRTGYKAIIVNDTTEISNNYELCR